MLATKRVLLPSSSLPPWSNLRHLAEAEVLGLLQHLSDIYCPLAFQVDTEATSKPCKVASSEVVDSGYTSGAEEEGEDDEETIDIAALRIDAFERSFAERWLTTFIGRVDGLVCLDTDEKLQRAMDQASDVLEALNKPPASYEADEPRDEDDLSTYSRDFSFDLKIPARPQAEGQTTTPIHVKLNDGLAGTNSEDPYDVGLQSWGASIVVSALLCESPARFGLTPDSSSPLGHRARILELGAGTGLVGLVLAKALPLLGVEDATVVSTDYHPAVLANLRANIACNFADDDDYCSTSSPPPMQSCFLDWSAPAVDAPPLDARFDMLIATDVIYAREHAVWLRDCAGRLLGPDAVFWLVATIRPNGRLSGLVETIEEAFSEEDALPVDERGRKLGILFSEDLDKRPGVGRGDESGYRLFGIGWA